MKNVFKVAASYQCTFGDFFIFLKCIYWRFLEANFCTDDYLKSCFK